MGKYFFCIFLIFSDSSVFSQTNKIPIADTLKNNTVQQTVVKPADASANIQYIDNAINER